MSIDINAELQLRFKKKNLQLNIEGFKSVKSFRDIEDFKLFIEAEVNFWSKYESFHSSCREICNYFKINILDRIIRAINYANSNQLGSAHNELDTAIQHAQSTDWRVIYSSSTLAKMLLNHLSAGTADVIFEYLSNNRKHINNKTVDYWSGLIEFVLSKKSITKNILRKSVEAEQDAIFDIRDKYLSEYEKIKEEHAATKENTRTEVEAFKNELNSWKEKTIAVADMDLQNKEKVFDSMKESYTTQFNDLIERYENHISLKAPADYWKTLKRNYFRQGWIWMAITTLATGGFIWYLHIALNTITNWIAVGVDDAAWLQNVKSAFIFALIVSAGAFLIRQFVKLSMSAFHLSRDAEERLQLTTVYLSLLKEKGAVADTERSIILQSIFSRSDTGLLKGDSSPTMPTPVDVLMKNKPST